MTNLITTALTADGATGVLPLPRNPVQQFQQVALTIPSGTFGGGTATLQTRLSSGGAWVNTPLALTAAGQVTGYVFGVDVRLNLAGATSPNLTVAEYHTIGSPYPEPTISPST